MTYIYGLIDPRNGRVRYVGKSDNPKSRLGDHLKDKSLCHRTNWVRSLLSEGIKPELVILENVVGDWKEAERKWIAHFGRENLVNGTDGGDGGNISQETRLRMSIARKRRKYAKGRKHSPETRKKIGNGRRGKTQSEETRRHISESMQGHKCSDLTRKKLSRAAKGNRNMVGKHWKVKNGRRVYSESPMNPE